MGHAFSEYPEGVIHFKTFPYHGDGYLIDELQLYQDHCIHIREFDIIHDFSHQHLIARYNPNLPTLNIFWHAPCVAQYRKAPYNIQALSEWAVSEWKRFYDYPALYHQSIIIDTRKYKPSNEKRSDRFLAIGRFGAEKGHHNAINLCKMANVPLDIIAAIGTEGDDPQTKAYEQAILKECDGEQIRMLGDVSEVEKIRCMQTCRALIYATNHPEVTSHKIQECMLSGAPVIVPYLGALPEIVTQGVDGFLCRTGEEYLEAIKKVDELHPEISLDALRLKYSVENVMANTIPLYQKIKSGFRW